MHQTLAQRAKAAGIERAALEALFTWDARSQSFRAPGQATSYFYGYQRLMETRQAAVDFYTAAFGAEEVHRVGGTDDHPDVVKLKKSIAALCKAQAELAAEAACPVLAQRCGR